MLAALLNVRYIEVYSCVSSKSILFSLRILILYGYKLDNRSSGNYKKFSALYKHLESDKKCIVKETAIQMLFNYAFNAQASDRHSIVIPDLGMVMFSSRYTISLLPKLFPGRAL